MDFQLIYDGKALENNEISPRELSTALIAINDVLNQANQTINRGKAKIEIKVKASFETGCFKINFKVYQDLLDKAKDLLLSTALEKLLDAKELLSLIFDEKLGLFALLLFLKGSKPTKIIENGDGSFVVYRDAKQIRVEKKVLSLYKDFKLRKSLEGCLEPLKKDGIDDFGIIHNKENICLVKKESANYFDCPQPEQTKIEEDITFTTSVNIVNLSFKEGNKWFVNDGQSSFYAIVEDEDFLNKIQNSLVEFSKGDILSVKIRREQFFSPDDKKLKIENYIVKVLRHDKPNIQLNIF